MGLKISEEIDARYKDACKLCREKHFEIYGKYPVDCAFREFDNEYCPDIESAERQRLEREKLSPVMSAYLQTLEKNGAAYSFILSNALDFSRAELIAIIRAFDYAISPYIVKRVANLGQDKATDIYKAVAHFARSELNHSSSEGGDVGKSIEEIIKEKEERRIKK